MKEKTTNSRIDVSLLGRGYAAVNLVDITDENGTYTDIQQTGIGRYKNRDYALAEAREWSKAEGVPLIAK